MRIIPARIMAPQSVDPPDRGDGLFTDVPGNQAPPAKVVFFSQLLST
jgi:hypothetical protein